MRTTPGLGRRRAAGPAALVAAALAFTGCDGDGASGKAKPRASGAPHFVFSKPLDKQPSYALGSTRLSPNAQFSQRLTFASKSGDMVLTTAGRLDFAGNRATATSTWSFPEALSGAARERVLGTGLGKDGAEAGARIEVDAEFIHYRPEGTAYWLRYAAVDEGKPGASAQISRLRGYQAPLGHLLLDVVPMTARTTWQPAPGGGRTYRTRAPLYEALDQLFPFEAQVPLSSSSTAVQTFPLTVTTDAAGRIVRAEAELSALRSNLRDTVGEVSEIKAVLTLTGYGRAHPDARPATDKVLPAEGSVRTVDDWEPGDCADTRTGSRSSHMVVLVECDAPHDIRLFARVALPDGAYPGKEAARRQSAAACSRAHGRAPSAWTRESVAPGKYWMSWPSELTWGNTSPPRANCFVHSR